MNPDVEKIEIDKNRQSLLILAIGVLALPMLSACTVGPNYVKPTVVAPTAYKELNGWKIAQPRDGVIPESWWTIFHDPQLNGLIEQVKLSNQNLAIAESQFRQARALAQSARAAYYPVAAAGLSSTYSHSSANQGNAGSMSRGDKSTYSLPADFTWEIDLWGRIRRTIESREANVQASAVDLEWTRLSIEAELALDYFQLCALDAQKQLLDRTVFAYEKSLELTKNRYAKGVVAKTDVLMAETQLKTTQAQAVDIGVQRARCEHAIAVLVGNPASVFSIPLSPLSATPPIIPAGVPSELLERRPDIASAERQVAAANAQIGAVEAAYYPRITLGLSGGLQSSDIVEWMSWPSRFWSVGPAISETIFDGNLRKAQSDQAIAAYDGATAAYRQTALAAFQEVEDNLAALRILEEEAKIQEEAIQTARQSLTQILNRYKAGRVGYLDVIITQTSVLSNERIAVEILGRRMNASVLLLKALGGGWKSSGAPSRNPPEGNVDRSNL